MKLKACMLLLLLGSSATHLTRAQSIKGLDTVRIDKEKLFLNINKSSLLYKDDTHAITSSQFAKLDFKDTIPNRLKITPDIVQKDIYLKFIVASQADTSIGFYFFPGIYYQSIKLYRLDSTGNTIEELPAYTNEVNGFKKILLGPHQATTFLAKLKFAKTNTNSFTPVLVRDYYQKPYYTVYRNVYKTGNIITFVFSGILLMMIFYSIAVFLLNKNIEFLYYSGFAFCMGLMLFLKSYNYGIPSSFNNFFEAYLDFIMQSVGIFIYLAFLRKFIDTAKSFPWLNKMLLIEQCFIIGSIFLFTYLYFETERYLLQDWVEGITKYVWILGTVIFIIYAIRKNNKLLNYLAAGHFFLLVGGIISLFFISSLSAGFRRNLPVILNSALLYYELGLVAELMFFLVALAFKNRKDIVERTKEREQLKLITERQDFEKLLAVLSAQQDERNRISTDMHDELGSGITAIRLMSELLRAKLKDTVFPEIDKISNNANELIIKMNTLIWTMKSDNDSVESLITYVRIYALEFFENTTIECVVSLPATFPNIELSGGKRRSLFLSIKESLNNVLKHSKAARVNISFSIGPTLTIIITDNGLGIDFNNLRRFGNGLSNIKKRIEDIEGKYKIENNPEGGAKTTIELDL
jgi:signal transduction histidine kinase